MTAQLREALDFAEVQKPSTDTARCSPAASLPQELLLQIFPFVSAAAGVTITEKTCIATLYSCTLVSRNWYSAAVAQLYERPYLDHHNFAKFVGTVCPSINAHIRKSALSGFVRHLDLSNLTYESSKSLTARLLGRVKENLESFVAPQASFS